jgi:hypothetical protein
MKNKLISSITVATMLIAGAVLPVSAQTALDVNTNATATVSGVGTAGLGANVGASVSLAARFKNIVTRADQEIQRRITALNALSTRVNAMVKLSADEKSSLSSSIQGQLSAMSTLETQVSADAAANNTSSLKLDAQSITKSYRIFALVLPQGRIEAASDRVLTIASTTSDLSAKFSARISAAQAAGNNVTVAASALADFNAKVADATAQAQAAATEVASLTPDNGVTAQMQANTAALKDAHAKILVAQKDFVTARADAQTIIKALASFKVSASASTTASTSVQ